MTSFLSAVALRRVPPEQVTPRQRDGEACIRCCDLFQLGELRIADSVVYLPDPVTRDASAPWTLWRHTTCPATPIRRGDQVAHHGMPYVVVAAQPGRIDLFPGDSLARVSAMGRVLLCGVSV